MLKASSTSNPAKLAGAIAGTLNSGNTQVEIQCIGAGATNQAIKAIAIARGYMAPLGINLACIPTFSNVIMDDEEKTAVKLTVIKL